LESKHREKPNHRDEGETKHGHCKHNPQKGKKWWYACKLFKMYRLKEAAMCHTDLLLGRDLETDEYNRSYAICK
jgi:hypothetical protein